MIKLVIFDWAGTTIDYGCFAPVEAFRKAFLDYKIEVTLEEIRLPMGTSKKEHIATMLEMPRIKDLFYKEYNRDYNEDDVNKINESFEKKLFLVLDDYTDPIDGVVQLTNELKEKGINIGSTTGYTSQMMEVVEKNAKIKGYSPDYISTAQIAGAGRPSSLMIEDNMRHFKISDKNEVIKVGDTISDILEGVNSKVKTVGVIMGSSELGKSIDEEVQPDEIERVRKKFYDAGADYVIENIKDLSSILNKLND